MNIGRINIINNVSIIIILIFNLFGAVKDDPDKLKNLIFILPLLLVSFYATISRKNKNIIIGILYFLAGIFTTIIGDSGNTTGILFFIFAIHFFKRHYNIIYITALFSICTILLKAVIFTFNFDEVINFIVFYTAAFLIYYNLFDMKGNENG